VTIGTACVVLLASLVAAIAAPGSSAAALTEGARLAAVYDSILNARFDRVESQLKDACPPAPEEACRALEAVAVWWRILLDPNSRRLDEEFNTRAAEAIAASEAWTKREPRRAESWFYLAGSYAPLVQWRVLRGERLPAAREGKKIKDALERALALDPTLTDAYFGIGLYHYYADVVPATAKILRWLLFLPGGDRMKGMHEMLQARERGELVAGEADYQLHLLYLWYEQKPTRAMELLEGLSRRYPANPLYLQRIAEVHDEYFHDHPASAGAWRALLDGLHAGRLSPAAGADVRARLGLARQLDAMFETDRARDLLAPLVREHPAAPYGAAAQAHLQLGAAHDRLGEREQAIAEYRAALAAAPPDEAVPQLRSRARAGLRQAPDKRRADAYRLSLDGWRALERGDAELAEASLTRAIEVLPDDMVARYRYARALDASGQHDRARREIETIVDARSVPAIVRASALVERAQTLERAGDRARALAMYEDAAKIVGADPHARDQATRAMKRLADTRKLF